ncbi:MAG: S9 family peptidase [candidate division KSB1 bacterium]|nr:S9 family peptidase [candidate division KSB1 bacterium]
MEIEGLLLKPVGYEPGKKLPLIVSVHGGPSGMDTWTFQGLEQMLAGRGYAVLMPNYRGSSYYGDAFIKANHGDLGGGDFKDIMVGVDYLIAQGLADPDRLGIMGWSYGGYMTAWAVTQTDRFKAGVDGAGITDWFSMYGQNDIPGYIWDLMEAASWKNYNKLEKASPMTYVHRVVTPTLLLHGENDNRVPIAQAQQFYAALKRRGVPVEMVVFPRSGHGIREPKLQLERYRRTVAWFEKWITGREPLDENEVVTAANVADAQ